MTREQLWQEYESQTGRDWFYTDHYTDWLEDKHLELLQKPQEPRIPPKFCVFLSAGHGGLHPISGAYQSLAGGKKHKHNEPMHTPDGWFYEGVWNRTLTDLVAKKLNKLRISVVRVHLSADGDFWRDMILKHRVDTANAMSKVYRNAIYISNHSNAFDGVTPDVRGFECYYYPKSEMGRKLALEYHTNVRIGAAKNGFDIRMRGIKSAKFYELEETKMPAILAEHLFFDNLEDARLLMNPDVVEMFADAQVQTVLEYMKTLLYEND
jgi:N-acetylmuramoyl-L-alanine amidase